MIGDRWGVTDDEVARRYPCDDVVRAPTLQAWRGVTVHGDPFTSVAGRPQGRVLAVDPGRALTAEILGAAMSYVLVPVGEPASAPTRLLLEVVGRTSRWIAPALSVGDLVMARRQLGNLARLAERPG